jgi:hypothetical protein
MTSIGIKGFIKRALPFFATFAISLLIASFFIDLSRPRFSGKRGHKFQQMRQLRVENEQLKNENEAVKIENSRLRHQLESRNWDGIRMNHGHEDWPGQTLDGMVPPPPIAPVAPAAPLPPRALK